MDSLTHLVAGALTPLAFPGAPRRGALLGFGIIAGELPDIDIFFGNSPEALMVLHRGITHALIWQPVLALIILLLFYLWMQRGTVKPVPGFPPWTLFSGKDIPIGSSSVRFGAGSLYLVALFALYTHIYLDCMTTFGTQILLPFSNTRVGFPSMFIVDLALTLPALALMVYVWTRKPEYREVTGALRCGMGRARVVGTAVLASPKARRAARVGLAWILLYPLAALGVNAAATAVYAPKLAQGKPLILLTEPFSPFVWKAVIDEGKTYRMGTLYLASSASPEFETFIQPEPMLYETLKKQNEIFRYFEDFAPLMIQSERAAGYGIQAEYGGNVTEYSFADLRYLMSPRSPARFFGRTDPNFILEARVSESGTLLAYRFLQRGNLESTPWGMLQ